jgi:hypothetical protein
MGLCPSWVFNQRVQYIAEVPLLAGNGCSVCEGAFEYLRRRPEESVLYHVVAENIETFLSRQQDRGRVVPRFVERELRSFLDSGVPANGFVRVHRDATISAFKILIKSHQLLCRMPPN